MISRTRKYKRWHRSNRAYAVLQSALVGFGWAVFLVGTTSGQTLLTVEASQVTRPVATVTDPDLVDFVLFQLIIEPSESPTGIQVIDVTRNGFGPDDVVVVLPTMETFMLPEVLPDSVQSIMGRWVPDQEFRFDSGEADIASLAKGLNQAPPGDHLAEQQFMLAVLKELSGRYDDQRMSLHLDWHGDGFTFQMWNYNENALRSIEDVRSSEVAGAEPRVEMSRPPPNVNADTDPDALPTARALRGLHRVPDDYRRELAARTILLGSYDLDRSGYIDSAAELNAMPCSVWFALEHAFPNFAQTFGFVDDLAFVEQGYYGSLVFNISERVKRPAARIAVSCFSGLDRPSIKASDVASIPERRPPPASLVPLLDGEAAATIVRDGWHHESGSAAWAAVVRHTLIRYYDYDGSGLLDQTAETSVIPCVTWKAVLATYSGFLSGLGFEGARTYAGHRIGVATGQRDLVRDRVSSCGPGALATRFPPTPSRIMQINPPDRGRVEAAANALRGLGSVPDRSRRELAAKTILLGSFDVDGSGYVDRVEEIDAISCAVWLSLQSAFPGLQAEYGIVDDAETLSLRYFGSLVFNISERVKLPAARRASACLNGRPPQPTAPGDVAPPGKRGSLTPELATIVDSRVAARVMSLAGDLEPGSAAWASVVRRVLIDAFDRDGSALIDNDVELSGVPCIVWKAVLATYPGLAGGLGFEGSRRYSGERIGIALSSREATAGRLLSCLE